MGCELTFRSWLKQGIDFLLGKCSLIEGEYLEVLGIQVLDNLDIDSGSSNSHLGSVFSGSFLVRSQVPAVRDGGSLKLS